MTFNPSIALADYYHNNNNNNSNHNNNRNKNGRLRRRHSRQEYANKLCQAVRFHEYSAVEELLKGDNSDPDARSQYGWCPLHISVANNDIKMTELLLENGANVNIQDMTSPYLGNTRTREFSDKIHANAPTQGFTPLHYAVALLNKEMIKLLCESGANPDIQDSRKLIPTDYLNSTVPQQKEIINLVDDSYEEYMSNYEAIERKKRLQYPLEKEISSYIVGQKYPINSVSNAIRRKLNGWSDPNHPLVFLFLGSSGVGKTELAKTLSKVLYKNDKNKFIRIDMSEFQHKHEVSKFIGSPPGYVGYEQGGQLTKKLKENPNAIVLLDEVEKAHNDVLTIMLQLFDEGRITDGKGETIECKDAIFIMTSNLAQTEIGDEAELLRKEASIHIDKQHNMELNDSNEEEIGMNLSKQFIEDTVQPILKSHFGRDEFLGRINEILYFLPFNERELKELTTKELNKWRNIAKTRHNIDIDWDDSLINVLKDGYNFRYGARSLQHEVEKIIINKLAKMHEEGKIKDGSNVKLTVNMDNNNIKIEYMDGNNNNDSNKSSGWW